MDSSSSHFLPSPPLITLSCVHRPDTSNTLTRSTPLSADLSGLVSITTTNNSSAMSSSQSQRGFIWYLIVLDSHKCLCDQTVCASQFFQTIESAKQVLIQLLGCGVFWHIQLGVDPNIQIFGCYGGIQLIFLRCDYSCTPPHW